MIFFLLKWSYNYDSWILVLRNKVAFNSLRTNDTHKRTVNYSQLQKKKKKKTKKKKSGGRERKKEYERDCGSTLYEVSVNESLTKAVLQLNFASCPCDWVTIFKSNPSHKIKTTFRWGGQWKDVSSGNITSLSANLQYTKNKMQNRQLSHLCSWKLCCNCTMVQLVLTLLNFHSYH